jgi:7-cyano-7-deazaguanine synthase
MITNNGYVLVLTSGGLDSAACIHHYKKLDFYVELLFVDYDQNARTNEIRSARNIADHYKVDLDIVRVSLTKKMLDSMIQGRNALFYTIGLLNFKKKSGLVALGIHHGTSYYDCSKSFLEHMNNVFSGYSNGLIIPSAPFIDFNKSEIYEYCLKENVPIELTYSCEVGGDQPCGICPTCKDLKEIYACKKF